MEYYGVIKKTIKTKYLNIHEIIMNLYNILLCEKKYI